MFQILTALSAPRAPVTARGAARDTHVIWGPGRVDRVRIPPVQDGQ